MILKHWLHKLKLKCMFNIWILHPKALCIGLWISASNWKLNGIISIFAAPLCYKYSKCIRNFHQWYVDAKDISYAIYEMVDQWNDSITILCRCLNSHNIDFFCADVASVRCQWIPQFSYFRCAQSSATNKCGTFLVHAYGLRSKKKTRNKIKYVPVK